MNEISDKDILFYMITEDHPVVPETLYSLAEVLRVMNAPIKEGRLRNLSTGLGVPSSKVLSMQLAGSFEMSIMENIKGYTGHGSTSGRWWDLPDAPLPDLYNVRNETKSEIVVDSIKVLFPMLYSAARVLNATPGFMTKMFYYPWHDSRYNEAVLLQVFFRDIHVVNIGQAPDLHGQVTPRYWQIVPCFE
jgi:hypothetical protein